MLFDSLQAVDATLVIVEGRWWLFTNVSPHPAVRNYDELYAFHGPTPFGPWIPHRRNPVKSDARSARGAGRFFWKGTTLYRPSQDCSGRYGSAIVINRVDQLTPDAFQETVVGTGRTPLAFRADGYAHVELVPWSDCRSTSGTGARSTGSSNRLTSARVTLSVLGKRNMFTMKARAVSTHESNIREFAHATAARVTARQLRRLQSHRT